MAFDSAIVPNKFGTGRFRIVQVAPAIKSIANIIVALSIDCQSIIPRRALFALLHWPNFNCKSCVFFMPNGNEKNTPEWLFQVRKQFHVPG